MGGLAFSPFAADVTLWSLALIAGYAIAIAMGILLLCGVRWAWLPSLAILAAALVGIVVFIADVSSEPSGSDVEDMRPIVVMGGLMWAVGSLVFLVLLASHREPWRPVPPRPITAAPAGWFVDPQSDAHWRYWDGTTWTGHTAARHPPQPDPPSD